MTQPEARGSEPVRSAALLDELADVVLRVTPRGEILEANAAAAKLSGVAAAELAGRNLGDLLNGASLDTLRQGEGTAAALLKHHYGYQVPIELSAIPAADDAGNLLVVMRERRSAAPEDDTRREQFLGVIAAVGELLLRCPGSESFDAVVDTLAEATGADRAYISMHRAESDGRTSSKVVAERCRPGVASRGSIDFEAAPNTDARFAGWASDSSSGRPIVVRRDDAGAEDQPLLAPDTSSALIHPLAIEGELIGAIGLDDCTGERHWTQPENDLVGSVARSLSISLERERIEAALRQSEAAYRDVVDSSGDGLVTTDVDGIVVAANRAITEILALPESQVVGRHVREFAPPGEFRGLGAHLGRNAEDPDDPAPYTVQVRRADGGLVPVEIKSRPIRGDDGRPSGAQHAVRDVSERARTEGELERRAGYLAALVEVEQILLEAGLPQGYNRIVEVLRVATGASRVHISAIELRNADPPALVEILAQSSAPDVPAIEPAVMADLMQQSEPEAWALTLGSGKPMYGRAATVRVDRDAFARMGIKSFLLIPVEVDGEPRIALGFHESELERTWQQVEVDLLRAAAAAISITISRQIAEATVRQSEERYRAIVENAADGIISHDLNGTLITVNRTFAEMVGKDADELVGSSLGDCVVPEDVPRAPNIFRTMIREGGIGPFRAHLLAADGEKVPIEVAAVAIHEADGRIDRIQSVLRDLRESDRAEAELARRARYLAAIAEIELRLLEGPGPETYDTVTRLLCETTGASRVQVLTFDTGTPGQEVLLQSEASAPGVTTLRELGLAVRPYSHLFAEAVETLRDRGVFQSSGPDWPEATLSENGKRMGVQAFLMLPLVVGGQITGTITFHQVDHPRTWDETEIDLLRAGANSLAIAIDRERSGSELRLRSRYLAAIADIELRLLESPGQETFDDVLDLLRDVTGASRVELLMLGEPQRGAPPGQFPRLFPRAESLAPGVTSFAELQEGLESDTLHQDAMEILARGVELKGIASELPGAHAERARQFGIESVLVFPLFVHGEMTGMLGFHQVDYPRQWDDAEVDTLRAAATSIAIAVDREEAATQLERRSRYLAALADVGRDLLTTPGRRGYESVVQRLGEATGSSRVYIYEHDRAAAEQGGLTLAAEWVEPGAVSAFSDPEQTNIVLPFDPTGGQDMLRAGEPLILVPEILPPAFQDMSRRMGIASFLLLPLIVNGEMTGLLGFDTTDKGHTWEPAEVDLLRSAASALAVSLERERAQGSLAESESRLDAIFEYSPVGNALLGLDGRFLRVNRSFASMFGFRPEQLLGIEFGDLRTTGGEGWSSEAIAHLATGKTDRIEGEHRLKTAQGSELAVLTQLRLLRHPQSGTPLHIVAQVVDLTDRKAAEEALRTSEQLFRGIVESSQDLILIIDETRRVVFASPAAEALTGLSHTAWIGQDVFERMESEDRPAALAHFAGVLDGERGTTPIVFRARHTDGDLRSFEAVCVPLAHSGTLRRAMCSIRDITAKQKADEALRRSEDQLRAIIDNSLDTILLADLEGMITFASPNIRRASGYSPEEYIGTKLGARAEPADRPKIDAAVEAIVESGLRGAPARIPPVSFHQLHADGTMRRFEAVGNLLWDGDEATAIIVNARDVTDRERTQALVSRLGHIVDQSANEVLVVDATTFAVLQANRGAIENLGYSASTMIGMSFFSLCGGLTAQALERYRRERQDAPVVAEVTYRRRDSTTYPVEARIHYSDDAEEPVFLVVAADITERKKTEEALLQAQKLESLAVLAGGVAHDFNNILQAILGNAQLAALHVPPESTAREMLDQIATSGRHAASLARQMLDYAGEGQQRAAATHLSTVIGETLDIVRVSVPPGIELRTELERHLPTIRADKTQVTQVVLNLVMNAAESIGDRDGGTITIGTRTETLPDGALLTASPPSPRGGDFVILEVSDDGAGMDARTRRRIFDPFFTTKFTGRGLGLATVFGIVRGHKGTISIDSAPGEGATFTVRFPADASAPAATDAGNPARGT